MGEELGAMPRGRAGSEGRGSVCSFGEPGTRGIGGGYVRRDGQAQGIRKPIPQEYTLEGGGVWGFILLKYELIH